MLRILSGWSNKKRLRPKADFKRLSSKLLNWSKKAVTATNSSKKSETWLSRKRKVLKFLTSKLAYLSRNNESIKNWKGKQIKSSKVSKTRTTTLPKDFASSITDLRSNSSIEILYTAASVLCLRLLTFRSTVLPWLRLLAEESSM